MCCRLTRGRGSLGTPDEPGEGEQTDGCSESRESESASASHMELSFLALRGDRVVSANMLMKLSGNVYHDSHQEVKAIFR